MGLKRNAVVVAGQLATVAVLLAAYGVSVRLEVLPSSAFPTLESIASELFRLLQTTEFWFAVGVTLDNWWRGLAMGCVAGVVVGMVIGSSTIVRSLTELTIDALRPIPMMALFPLLILMLGSGEKLSVTLIALSTLWPMIVQTMYAMHDIDPMAVDVARSYRLGKVRMFFRVIIPSIGAYLFTGIRVSAAIGFIIAVGVSLLLGGHGMGAAIFKAQNAANLPKMYAYIFSTGIVALVTLQAVAMIERRVLHWHPSQREVTV